MARLAVIQRPPVLLDRERTLAAAVAAVAEAAAGGANLVVFPEAFVRCGSGACAPAPT